MRRYVPVMICLLLIPRLPLHAQPQDTALRAASPDQTQGKGGQAKRKLPPVRGASQHVLITATARHGATEEAEKVFRDQILPSLAASADVRSIKSFTNLLGCEFTYVVLLEVAPKTAIRFDSVLEAFHGPGSLDETIARLDQFASYFERHSISLVQLRPDLSISRAAAGLAQSPAASQK